MAGTGGVPLSRGGVPGVRGQGNRSWGERFGQPLPPSGHPMGCFQKRHADAGGLQPLQQPQGLVDLPSGPRIPGGGECADGLEPAVAASWHPSLNGTLEPEMVTVGSRRKVWWQCPEGHSWKAAVYSRTGAKKCGCPVCAGRGRPQRQRRYGPSGTVPGLEDTLN